MLSTRHPAGLTLLALGAALVLVVGGCGKKEMPYDTNLLKNGSFEEVGDDGLPKHWELSVFRGLENESEVIHEVSTRVAHSGKNSWHFRADPMTRRWLILSQEVEVQNATHVRLQGWMQTEQVINHPDQYTQCNFLLTFYDKDHNRFQELRVADRRTVFTTGTHLWFKEDETYRVPDGTHYVAVSCILGTDGRVWFDDVSLEVPKPIDWETRTTNNYVYHWLPGHPPPQGAIENQQLIFDERAARLGVKSDVVIDYYFYPDTTTIQNILSLKGFQYVSWPDREFHSINANDDHEVVHFITDPYGKPPRSIAEGTVWWLYGDWEGYPIRQLAAFLLAYKRLPTLQDLTNYNNFTLLDAKISIPAAAAFVDYLAARYGTTKLMDLYVAANGVNSYLGFSKALEQVYETPATQIEQEFRSALSRIDYSGIEASLLESADK
jgi:hypothetical protein